ncbi:hypothetical protein HN51_014216 [Arachis hypogaea]
MCGCSSQRRKTTLKGLKMLASKTSSSKGEVQSGTLVCRGMLGPKVEDVKKPVNPLVFFSRLILGAIVPEAFASNFRANVSDLD